MCEKCPPNLRERYSATETVPFADLSLVARNRTLQLHNAGAVRPMGGDRFEVRDLAELNLGPLTRTRVVRWHNEKWTCNTCSGRRNALRPCTHMAAVFLHVGVLFAESTIVATPGKERDQASVDAGKRRMAEVFPKLAAQLCDTVRAKPTSPLGRIPNSARDLMFAALRYVESNRCLRETEGQIRLDHTAGYVQQRFSYPLISQYLKDPTTAAEIDRLLLTIFIATSHFSRTVGLDGTGFQRRNFYQYAEDRAGQRAKDARKKKSGMGVVFPYEKRRRGYVQSIPLIVYETNIIPAVVCRVRTGVEESPYIPEELEDILAGIAGEAPYFLALLERVRPHFPQLERVRADMGFFKMNHYLWGDCYGVGVSIPFKSNFQPHGAHSGTGSRAAARAYHDWHADPEASYSEYHKRSNDEGMMNGVKVEFGGGVQTRNPEAQANEVRLKWLAFSLKQVVYLMERNPNWTPDFQAAAARLGADDLTPLREVAKKYKHRNADDLIVQESREAGKGPPR